MGVGGSPGYRYWGVALAVRVRVGGSPGYRYWGVALELVGFRMDLRALQLRIANRGLERTARPESLQLEPI